MQNVSITRIISNIL